MPARNGTANDPAIALVGIGCRYPGGVIDPASFWHVLRDGVDVIGEIPPERWGPEYISADGSAPGTGYCRYAGVLPGLDRFDADFFGISFREAREMDPQQRLLLEVSWEALENAGLTKSQLSGSRTGVFFGMLGMDYTLLHSKTRGVKGIDPYYASGKEFSFAPGRVAYTLGLHGPALAVNTACSSSLVAVHLACRALAGGEADTALAGGVNVLAAPELSIFMSKVQALSPTGRCKPFAAEADGIVRGEGCGVVVLKRLDDALADDDQVLAVIRGSAFNHDGRSAGLTVPNASAQEALLRDALRRADATPHEVAFVETHGTGTPLGDPIEAFALSEVFGPGRDPARKLHIGSHKANFGHTDAAAGVAALIKTVLTAQNRLVPPQLHLTTPNPAIPWADGPLAVSAQACPLDASEDTLFGVSAFGLSGTNAHVLLSAPAQQPAPEAAAPAAASRVLLLSGSTQAALQQRARDLAGTLEGEQPLADVLHTAAVRRTHHEARATVIGANAEELRSSLRGLAEGSPDERTVTGTAEVRRRHRTVFVFSGQGSQWRGMGLDLWEHEPVAAASLERSDEVLRSAGLPGLHELLGEGDPAATEFAQPTVVALQLALAEVWTSRGVVPSKVVGHSLGEISAACFTGALDLSTALDLAVRRGRIMADAAGTGRMLVVALPEEEAVQAAAGTGRPVTVATVNGPSTTVLAGSGEDLTAIASLLREQSVSARFVPGDYAFHSPAMTPFAELLRAELADLPAVDRPAAFVSTVWPDEPVAMLDADYWAANMLRPVRFWPAVRELLQGMGADFVEIGPHPTLVRPLNDALTSLRRQGVAVGSLRRDTDGPATLLASLAELHCAGAEVRWADLIPGRSAVLPRHPWQHESFWLPGVAPGSQYAPGAAPGAQATAARLAVQLLGPSGDPIGPARQLDLTAPPTDEAPSGDLMAPVEPPRSAGAAPDTAPTADGTIREAVPSAAAPHHSPAGAQAADGTTALQSGSRAAVGPASADRERRSLMRLASHVLAEVLGQDTERRIPPRRGFADLGLDSLSIVEFVDRLGLGLGLDIPLSTPFEHPCLDELVDHLLPAVTARKAEQVQAQALATAQPAVPAAKPVPMAAATPAPAPAPVDDPVAVVGMSCRFPGAPSVQDYWQLLLEGREAIRDVPADRWDGRALLSDGSGSWTPGTITSLRGGYLNDVRGFDAAFFRISPREARSLDPQHRLFLEVAYEALEDAGATRDRLRASATGVFVGMNSADHALRVGSRLQDVDLYYGTGNSFAGAAGRLSYFLGLTGPSMAVDTACSSSLTAVHLAVQSLHTGESDLAVAGGVNVILSPVIPIAVSAGGALSPSGQCRTFDESADGYLRGEGSGAVVLKRLSTALADGDRIYAVLPGSAVNQDGASSGLTVPNGTAQRALIEQALQQAGLSGPDVGYAEAHGTGTPLGDPIELRALAQALRPGGPGGAPLLVGSAKPNIGHLEASAGMAGLIKAVLSVHRGRIAPHIGVTTEPTRQVAWERLGLRIAGSTQQWPGEGRRRIAGVSSFGFTGTNAHVLVAQAPVPDPGRPAGDLPARFALPLSAAQATALPAAARQYLPLVESGDAAALADLAYTASARRSHLEQRAVVVGQDVEGVRLALRSMGRGEEHPRVLVGTAELERSCVFVFSGFGSQWTGMGRRLLETEPVFRDAVLACEEEMRKWIAWSPLASLRGEANSRPFDEGIPQELVFAVQVGLVELWRSWGVVPAAVVGHSMGEVAAAWTAGALTLAQAAEVLCLRSRLLDTLVGTGGSIVVGLPPADLAPYLVLYEDTLGIAAINGPRTTVVAGDVDALAELTEELTEANVFVRRVRVPVAPHSPLMEPLRERLVSGLAHLVPSESRIPLYSAVEGREVAGSSLTAGYWGRNLRDTVLFQDAVSAVEDPQDRVFVEVSPHPVLVSGIEESLRAAGVHRPVVLPSLVRDEDELGTLLTGLGTLHAQGAPVDWAAFAGPGRTVVDLPGYPWQRKEHWLADNPLDRASASGALVGTPVRPATAPWTALLPVGIDGTRSPWQVSGSGAATTVSPPALLEAALTSAAATGSPAPALYGVRFGSPPRTDEEGRADLQTVVDTRQGTLALRAPTGWAQDGEAALSASTEAPIAPASAAVDPGELADDEPLRASLADRLPGLDLRSAGSGRGAAEVTVKLSDGASRHRLPAELLRLALHLVSDGAGTGLEGPDCEPLPASIASVRVNAALEGTVRVRRGLLRTGAEERPEADVVVLDAAGRIVAELAGLRLAAAPAPAFDDPDRGRIDSLLYRMVWNPAGQRPADRDGAWPVPAARWLVCGDTDQLAGAVAEGLRSAGCEVRRVRSAGAAGSGDLVLDPTDREAWQTLLAAHADESTTGICDLWPLEDLGSHPDGWRATTALTAALAGAEGTVPRLWLVTRHALLPTGHEGFPDGNQGAHAGLGRTLAMTRPKAWGGHVDLSRGSAEELRALVTRLLSAPGDEHVRVEHSSVHVGSLVRVQAPKRTHARPLSAEGWHVVTGSGGALMPPVVDWLVGAGARRIVLVDTDPAPAAPLPAAERIARWQAVGAEVRTLRTQASMDELGVLVQRLRADGGIAGVLCAAAPELATPLEATTEAVLRTEWNRAETAEQLHRLTVKDPVRLFVLLGSVPGTWGGAVTGAAAPSDWALRALAARRRASGLPVAHLELMPLEGSRLLDQRTTLLLKSSGVAALREADLVAALDLLARDNTVHMCVADVDWELFGSALADAPHRELFRTVMGAAKQTGGTEFIAGLGVLDPEQRRDRMLDWVCTQVAGVLGLPEDDLRADQGFFELGMDSVMSLTLRLRLARELETELSSTVAFEHPTALALTAHLLEQLGHPAVGAGGATADTTGPDVSPVDAGGDTDDLDDEELLRQLEAEISDSQVLGFEEN
ncbi:beta-ketoacyl synthase N-terminal-like domain-containing protein [Streptomyces polyrhachis]|uniref:Beta-ketoacyl synthase N-terminal-like domain-containing protein n=1 Tax=Streptomyces polyrhachis TaxID=1282885 RepID=A0ABW2GIV0_9ACTN